MKKTNNKITFQEKKKSKRFKVKFPCFFLVGPFFTLFAKLEERRSSTKKKRNKKEKKKKTFSNNDSLIHS